MADEVINNWLKGCEICNGALVTELKCRIEKGTPILTAAKELSDETVVNGVRLYSPGAIRQRFKRITGECTIRTPPQKSHPKNKKSRGSYEGWKKFKELYATAKETINEMSKIKVDQDNLIKVREIWEEIALIATQNSTKGN